MLVDNYAVLHCSSNLDLEITNPKFTMFQFPVLKKWDLEIYVIRSSHIYTMLQ